MAGIGFRLKRLIVDGSYSGWLRAHLYGAVLSAGPWLLSICTLGTLALLEELQRLQAQARATPVRRSTDSA